MGEVANKQNFEGGICSRLFKDVLKF